MGVSGVSEQTTQLGLFKWEDGPDRYNHVELYQNWDKIDSALLRKGWAIAGDEATQLRFGATGTATLAATALIIKSFTGTADTQDRFNLTVGGSASWGAGGSAAQDTNLYRNTAASLKTDAAFTAMSLTLTAGAVAVTRAGTANSVLTGLVSGDSNSRLSVDAAGVHVWGPGNTSGDTNLYRSAADTLKTDDKFVVGSGTITLNDYNISRSGSGTATANGNFVITGNLAVSGNLTLSGSAFQGTVSLSDIIASNMNISGNGTVANLLVTNSATFNSAAGSTTFTNGLNINGVNLTRPGAGTVQVAGKVILTDLLASGKLYAENTEAVQVAIGSLSGTAAISFGSGEDVHFRRASSSQIRTNAALAVDTTLTAGTVTIGSPSATSKLLNVGGDIYMDGNKGIYFGNTSDSSGAGNRMVISYNAGNGYLDVATGGFYIRDDSLNPLLTIVKGSEVQMTLGNGTSAPESIFTASTLRTTYLYTNGLTSLSTGTVSINATINMNNNAIVNLSDARLKKNFVTLDDETILDDFNNINVSQWQWIDTDNMGVGPTAQQLNETSFNEYLVKKSEDNYLQVNSTNVQGVLFAAVSALTRKVRELESKL